MDKPSVHQKSPRKAMAVKKKQIKVVYISNPMRVKTSAAEFKGLVQELTGQDSDVADLSKFTDMEQAEESQAAADRSAGSAHDNSAGACRQGVGGVEEEPHHHQRTDLPYTGVGTPLDMFEEVFTPQILENLAAFMPSPFYEPPPCPPRPAES